MSAGPSLEKLYTAVVADILDAHGLRHQCLDSSIMAATPANRIAGRAYTLRARPVDREPEQPYKLEMEAVDTALPGDVLVVDADFDRSCGFWGELLTTACIAKGIKGVVMSACTRDLWSLEQIDFPVFAIGSSPADSKGRLDVVAIGDPIEIDGVTIETGDLILGDQDGIVVIPQNVSVEIISAAQKKISGENTVRDELSAGVPVAEVFRRHGIL